jgi:hypothetical protein
VRRGDSNSVEVKVEEAVPMVNQAYTILCITTVDEEVAGDDETARVRVGAGIQKPEQF